MRYIDAFNHFNPKRYFDALLESPAGQKDIGKRVRGIPALFLFKDGQVVSNKVGAAPKAALETWIQSAI